MAGVAQKTVYILRTDVDNEVEELPDDIDAKVLLSPRGEVKFENVDFGYKEGEPLIKNMNIDIKQGHTIAIVGPTG